MNILVVIPARYESSRLPGKPLVHLCGVPMIIRTYRQCLKAVPAEKIVVATDDERIRQACEAEGIQVVMTSDQCLTGTDRVAEVAAKRTEDVFINVQGDEPVFAPRDLLDLIEAAQASPDSIINGYCEIASKEDFVSTSIPKVVFKPDGSLLYMSRSPIPGNKSSEFSRGWRQVCAYAFPKEALAVFSGQKTKTPLEQIEDIEILRFLELGFDVRMIPMSDQSVAVDSPSDISRAENAIRELGLV